MAITTNFASAILALVIDINSADTAELANAVYIKSFEVSKLSDSHSVIPGVRTGNIVPILSNSPNYLAFPYKNPADCNIPACDLDLPFDAKQWDLGMIACKTPICINTFNDNFLNFWGEYRRVFGDADLDGALITYIVEKFQQNLDAAIWRIGWFGDKTTPSGDSNYPYLRPINGIFTQAEAMDGIKIPIEENTSGVDDAAEPLTGERVYELLNEAYIAAINTPWFDESVSKFEMTKAMAAVWVAWLNSLKDRSMYNCECYDADSLTAKKSFSIKDNLFAFGIKIEVHQEFDGVITQLSLGYPYRALLTADTNILFGTSEIDQAPAFRIWYDPNTNNIYIEGGAHMGATLVTDEYVYLGAEAV